MKPASWEQLPAVVQEQFLWDCDLDYDSYESSKAECIHDSMNGGMGIRNRETVDTAWKFMSEDSFKLRLEQARDSLKDQLRQVEELLDNHRRFV